MIGFNLTLDKRELDAAAARTMNELDRGIVSGVERGGETIADEARATTAFRDRSGDLRGDIDATEVKPDEDGASIEVEADAGHAKFLEGGTRFVTAHPFLGPALDADFDEACDGFVGEVDRALERAGW